MKTHPVSLALRKVAETKNLVESLILSSESFDYEKAKATVKELERKMKELEKLQSRLEKLSQPTQSNVHVVNFKSAQRSHRSAL